MADTKDIHERKLAPGQEEDDSDSPTRQVAEADHQLTDPSAEVDKKRQVKHRTPPPPKP